jgi:hypothetical protein
LSVNHAAIQFALNSNDFRGLTASFESARSRGNILAVMWLFAWRSCHLHDCREIARLEGRKTIYRTTVIDDEPHIQTDFGCYSVEELGGKLRLPSLADIERESEKIRTNWASEEMQLRAIGDYRNFLEG